MRVFASQKMLYHRQGFTPDPAFWNTCAGLPHCPQATVHLTDRGQLFLLQKLQVVSRQIV